MTPSEIRAELEEIQLAMNSLEARLNEKIQAGSTGYCEIRHELTESSEGVDRAMGKLDENYAELN